MAEGPSAAGGQLSAVVRSAAMLAAVLIVPYSVALVIFTDYDPGDLRYWGILGGGFVGGFIVMAIAGWVTSRGAEQKAWGRLVYVTLALVPLQGVYLFTQDDVGRDPFTDFSVVLVTAGPLWALTLLTGFWRRWVPTAHRDSRSALLIVADTAVMLVVLTMSFGGITSVLEAHGIVTTSAHSRENPVWDMEVFFAWQFWDSIPELEVPTTLSWDKPFSTTNAVGGVMILVFKVLVILPVLAALTDLWRQRRDA